MLPPYPGYVEGPDGVRGELRHVHQKDLHHAVRLRTSVGPVLVTLNLQQKQLKVNSYFH